MNGSLIVGRFRKLPVVIEAMRWDGSMDSQAKIVTWTGGVAAGYFDGAYFLEIVSLEGPMRADPGDWIIRGVKGEFYPCKADIFALTYEPVGE